MGFFGDLARNIAGAYDSVFDFIGRHKVMSLLGLAALGGALFIAAGPAALTAGLVLAAFPLAGALVADAGVLAYDALTWRRPSWRQLDRGARIGGAVGAGAAFALGLALAGEAWAFAPVTASVLTGGSVALEGGAVIADVRERREERVAPAATARAESGEEAPPATGDEPGPAAPRDAPSPSSGLVGALGKGPR